MSRGKRGGFSFNRPVPVVFDARQVFQRERPVPTLRRPQESLQRPRPTARKPQPMKRGR
jgi:hypothetical protein